MADSIQETMADDGYLEDLCATMREQDSFAERLNAHTEEIKAVQDGKKENDRIEERISRLETQVSRILLQLGIALPSEILVTDQMPNQISNPAGE